MMLQNFFFNDTLYENIHLTTSIHTDTGTTQLTALHGDEQEYIAHLTVDTVSLHDLTPDIVRFHDTSDVEHVLQFFTEHHVITPAPQYDEPHAQQPARGARLVDSALRTQAQELYEAWKEKHVTWLHLLDKHENPIMEHDEVTPVIVALTPHLKNVLEQYATQREVSVEEAILHLLDRESAHQKPNVSHNDTE